MQIWTSWWCWCVWSSTWCASHSGSTLLRRHHGGNRSYPLQTAQHVFVGVWKQNKNLKVNLLYTFLIFKARKYFLAFERKIKYRWTLSNLKSKILNFLTGHFHNLTINVQYAFNLIKYLVCLLVCGFSSHSKFFTHLERSPLLVKGYKFWPMFDTHGHWAVRVNSLTCHTYCDMG